MASSHLSIGSVAPPLTIAKWISGQPIDNFQSDQVYVVEFWATWCGPCRTSMPHISELQQKHGDKVHFIGITDETEEIVNEFLAQEQSPGKTWKEVVQYRLALDNAGAANRAYMQAAGEGGIPTAFIVGKDSHVEWIGHPMTIDAPLEKVLDGTWDRQAEITRREQSQQLKNLSQQLQRLMQEKNWDQALALLDRLEEASGASAQITAMRMAVLKSAGRTEDAAQQMTKLVEQEWSNAQLLNAVAWGIAAEGEVGGLELAEKAALRSSELTDNKNGAILDTVARIYYEKGDLDKAIEWQKKAVENNPERDPELDETLKKYEQEKAAKSGGAAN